MDIALFPLKTVLFPDGVLPLRVFEPRYVDMVRECMKSNAPFGACLITQGGEVGVPAQTHEVGCLASIESWDMRDLGVLLIRARGGRRFRIVSRRIEGDGLQRARVEPIEPDVDAPIDPGHAGCVGLLRRVIADLDAQREEGADSPIGSPHRLDSCVWVGNRLCEILPIPLTAKQKLMELDDAPSRLTIVDRYLRQHEVIR